MANSLIEFSQTLAEAVETASRSVAGVLAHPRVPASGIAWQDGVIVTSDHMLKGLGKAEISLSDGVRAEATVAGRDTMTDIAVLKTDRQGLNIPVRADASALRCGNVALAVGRSQRSGTTASFGVLSSVGGQWRTWRGGPVEQFIQLDIAVYPGANGGAVVDGNGQLIGMATSLFSRYGSVAIPAATIDRVVRTILETGYIPRGYLGVGLRAVAVPDSIRPHLNKDARTALIVLSVEENSAAAKAGLMIGDLLVSLDGQAVEDADDVQSILTGGDAVGKPLSAKLVRGGQPLEVTITVGERKREEA